MRHCKFGRSFTPERLIALLAEARSGDGNTGIHDLGRRIRACRKCKRQQWVAEVIRPPAKGTPEYAKMEREKTAVAR